jgi:hypothetical protein
MRAIFFNEGNLGTHVVGHGPLEQALRVGLHEQRRIARCRG